MTYELMITTFKILSLKMDFSNEINEDNERNWEYFYENYELFEEIWEINE
jgi:hypothetical protein